MLTDIFATRYADKPLWNSVGEVESALLVQSYRLIAEELMPLKQNGKVAEAMKGMRLAVAS